MGSARLRKHDEQRVVEATATVTSTTEGRLVQIIVKRNCVRSQTGVQNTCGERQKNMDNAIERKKRLSSWLNKQTILK